MPLHAPFHTRTSHKAAVITSANDTPEPLICHFRRLPVRFYRSSPSFFRLVAEEVTHPSVSQLPVSTVSLAYRLDICNVTDEIFLRSAGWISRPCGKKPVENTFGNERPFQSKHGRGLDKPSVTFRADESDFKLPAGDGSRLPIGGRRETWRTSPASRGWLPVIN